MMKLAVYALLLTAAYAVLAVAAEEWARALLVGFVAAIVLPAVHYEHSKRRENRKNLRA